MVTWADLTIHGQTFDLTHLNAFEYCYIQPAEHGKPERQYRTWIRFSHHCFTESTKPNDDIALQFGSRKDGRSFNTLRWDLSKFLPDIIRSLMERTISHTGHNNYITIKIVDSQGQRIEYEIYFDVNRDPQDKRLHIVVTSAFPRDMERLVDRPKFNKIRLATILHNVQQNKPIRTTQR